MIDYTQTHKYHSSLPNVMEAILAHPCHPSERSIELGIFNSHRFAFYAWAKLYPHNDNHIVSATYLNLIGDIYVVHYGKINDGVKKFKDVHGNVHYNRKFEPHEQLMQHVERKVSNRYISIQIWIILLLKIQLQMTSNISLI